MSANSDHPTRPDNQSSHKHTVSPAAERETAVLDAWLNGEELPEGTLARELPWLRDLFWEMTARNAQRRSTRAWKMYREQALRQVGIDDGPCYRKSLASRSTTLNFSDSDEDEVDPDALPAGHLWGLSNDGNSLAIHCPRTNPLGIEFPGNLALVEWEVADEVRRQVLRVTVDAECRCVSSTKGPSTEGCYRAFGRLRHLFPEHWSAASKAGTIRLFAVTFRPEVLFRVHEGQLLDLLREWPNDPGLQRVERARRRLDLQRESD
jgi:hypothetical protein